MIQVIIQDWMATLTRQAAVVVVTRPTRPEWCSTGA